jgi:hypothetical protein
MAFTSPVVAGTTLVAPAIRSANYVPGVSGWTINRDGTSEFAGGTFRGAVVVIDPVTGNVLASIGANGNGSFQSVYATNDVIIGNTSVLAAITSAGRGILSRVAIAGTLPAVPPANAFVDACWIGFTPPDASRQYVLRSDPVWVNNANSINGETFTYRWILNQSGVNTTIYSVAVQVDPGSSTVPTAQIMLPALAAAPATLKLQYANNAGSGTYTVYNQNPFNLWIEDIGVRLSSGSGGTGSPSGTQQFTTQYFATDSQSYASPSGNSESDPNNLYIGQLSGRTNGSSENGVWCFPGSTIRTDISGATIQSAKLFMYLTGSSAADGSTFMGWLTNTTAPSTVPTSSFDGHTYLSKWPSVPSWGFIDITSMVSSDIVTGLANGVLLEPTGFTGSASWFGAGNATFKPYIQITYTK